jgi:glycosyl transferase family 29 (putative sialyltransferase)
MMGDEQDAWAAASAALSDGDTQEKPALKPAGLLTRLAFALQKRRRKQDALLPWSVSVVDLMDELAGKSVALVGNARALAETELGAEIDAADIVIRINRAPMPAAASHGSHTTWLALATSLPRADLERVSPARVLWMSPKRKRLSLRLARRADFYLYPLTAFRALQQRLGGPPTTGAMLIDLLSTTEAAEIRLYGFDFFASQSLSGRRSAKQVPHDFTSESAFVQDLIARDDRFHLIAMR